MKDPCSSISRLLERYVDRETTADEGILVQDHLRQCTTCEAQLKSMEELRATLRSPVDEAVKEETFAWMWQKIEREIQTREKPSSEEYVQSDTNNVMVFESERENVAIIWLFEETEGESST